MSRLVRSRFFVWATLDHVAKVADLALKLTGIVAVLAILSFFRGRGDLYPTADCWAPVSPDLYQVIASDLKLTAAKARLPIAALRAEARQPALPLGLGGGSMRIGCSRDIAAMEDLNSTQSLEGDEMEILGHPVRLRPLTVTERRKRIAVLHQEYPDAGSGLVHYVPELSVIIAADPALSAPDVKKVLEFIEKSRSIKVFVHVFNTGSADALNVTIPPPRGFSLIEGHPFKFDLPPGYKHLGEVGLQPIVYQDHPRVDLNPGSSVYFIFESPPGVKIHPVQISDIVPTGDTSPTVNVRHQLEVLGLLFALILMPLVVRDIRNTPTERSTAGTE